jgi:hypothetical protein
MPKWHAESTAYLGTRRHRLSAEDEAFVNRLVPPGAVSTHDYNNPVFPIEGRVPQCVGNV